MKANGAPEKIYIEVTPDGTRYYRDVVKEQRTENSDIEYIRKDAFIEKACKFLSEKCDLCNYEEFDPENKTYYINHDKIVEDFKNYMKGEDV